MTTPSAPHRLLLMACSERKCLCSGIVPAVERYDGPAFRVLRRYISTSPPDLPEVYILSAEFGLLSFSLPIPYYDRRMTQRRAQELCSSTLIELRRVLAGQRYGNILIHMGKDYLPAIDGYDTLLSQGVIAEATAGSLGRRLSQLHDWLYGAPPTIHTNRAIGTGRARIHGIDLAATSEQIIDAAKRALTHGSGNPESYQSWYVLIDDRRVSPKWLVSEIAGIPVNAFTSTEACRVLTQLGVKVERA